MYYPLPDCLELKTSPIHGLGIFATEDIPRGKCLGEFLGDYMRHSEFKSKYGNDTRYCYVKRRTWEYRVAKEKRNFITFMNDGVYKSKTPFHNVILTNWHAYAVCDIKKGDELLLNYGKYYKWNL